MSHSPAPGVTRYVVHPALEGERLDRAAAALTGLARRRVRTLADAGGLWLNGRPARVLSRQLTTADVLDVIAGSEPLAEPPPLPPPLPLLHDDAWLIAVDKPAGMLTQPGRERGSGELSVHQALAVQLAAREGRAVELLLIHRLDRLTSGVLLFARTHEAARALAATWAKGRADKRYLALVLGDPGSRTVRVDRALGPDPITPGRQRVEHAGRAAVTEIRRLGTNGRFSLVEATPRTGRTHQVRVHLAAAGCPVAGDRLYGGGHEPDRPFLHAWRLSLPNPSGGVLRLEAPIPEPMRAQLTAFGIALPA